MQITAAVEIEAPIERVWPLLNEDENLKLWMPDVVETTYPDGKPEGDPVGTRFLQRIREGGRISTYKGEVTAYEPRRLLGIRLGDDRHFMTEVVYRLRDEGPVTRLDYACRVDLKSWLARIMIVVGGPMMRRIVKRHMARRARVDKALPRPRPNPARDGVRGDLRYMSGWVRRPGEGELRPRAAFSGGSWP